MFRPWEELGPSMVLVFVDGAGEAWFPPRFLLSLPRRLQMAVHLDWRITPRGRRFRIDRERKYLVIQGEGFTEFTISFESIFFEFMQGTQQSISHPGEPVPIDAIIDHFRSRKPPMTWGEFLPLLELMMGAKVPSANLPGECQ